jgi:hypothetical protein
VRAQGTQPIQSRHPGRTIHTQCIDQIRWARTGSRQRRTEQDRRRLMSCEVASHLARSALPICIGQEVEGCLCTHRWLHDQYGDTCRIGTNELDERRPTVRPGHGGVSRTRNETSSSCCCTRPQLFHFPPVPEVRGRQLGGFSVAGVAGVFPASVKAAVKTAHKASTVTSAHGISLLTGGTLVTVQTGSKTAGHSIPRPHRDRNVPAERTTWAVSLVPHRGTPSPGERGQRDMTP